LLSYGIREDSQMGEVKRAGEPHDRLTRLCAVMTDALDAHPASGPDVKCVVMLQDGERGGIQIHGYQPEEGAKDPDSDVSVQAITDLIFHLQAILRGNGQDLKIVPMEFPIRPRMN
jgi:hypothetical protein